MIDDAAADAMLAPQQPGIPLPRPSNVSAPYWEACGTAELRFLRCQGCQEILMPPTTLVCWRCLGRDLRWERSKGRGLLRSWTVVWRPPSASFTVPFAPAVVEMAEGFDQLTAIVGCRIGDLQPDMAVEAVFVPTGGDVSLPYFQPVQNPSLPLEP